jgi:dihydroorotase-like cyclic amidohydrolase
VAPDTLVRAARAVIGGAERPASVRVRDGVVVDIGPLDADAGGAG